MEQKLIEENNAELQVFVPPNFALDSHNRHLVVEILNYTLANEAVLVVKTREANCEGNGLDLTEQKLLLNDQYKQLHDIIDEIAERSWMLDGMTIGGFLEYISFTRQEKQTGMAPDLLRLLASHEAVIRLLGEDAIQCREMYEDEDTFDLLFRVMRHHQEMTCLLRSLIESEQARGNGQERVWKDE